MTRMDSRICDPKIGMCETDQKLSSRCNLYKNSFVDVPRQRFTLHGRLQPSCCKSEKECDVKGTYFLRKKYAQSRALTAGQAILKCSEVSICRDDYPRLQDASI